MKPGWLGLTSLAIVIWSNAAAATTRVCVSVQQKSWYRSPPALHVAAPVAPALEGPAAPTPLPPAPSPPPPYAAASAVFAVGGRRAGAASRRGGAPDRSDALPQTDAGVRGDARERVPGRQRRLPAAPGRRAVSAGERLDGVRALRRARGEDRPGRARRVRGAGAADGVRALAWPPGRPDDHPRERAALRQRARSAHRRGDGALHLRHGDRGEAGGAADRAGAVAAGDRPAAGADARHRAGRLPAQAARLGIRRLRARRSRHRADRDSRQRSRRATSTTRSASRRGCTSCATSTRPASTRSTSAAAPRSSWRSSTPSGRSPSGPAPPTATSSSVAVSTSTSWSATSSCAPAPSTSSARSSSICRPTCSRRRTTAARSTPTRPVRWRRSGSSSSHARSPDPGGAVGSDGGGALFASAGVARAQLRTCVEVAAAPAETDALTRLIKSEIDRHPTHRAASSDCESTLTVEVIDLGPSGGKWITGRLNTQVPYRERVGADGLAPAVERLLTVLLHNDPLILRGPESQGWLVKQERAFALHSTTHYGLEAYELAAPVGGGLATLPGVALSLRREIDQVAIGVRLAGAFNPGGRDGRAAPRRPVRRPGRGDLLLSPGRIALAVRQRAGGPRLPALPGAGAARRSRRDRRGDRQRPGGHGAGRARGAPDLRRAPRLLSRPRGPHLRQPRSRPRRHRPVGPGRVAGCGRAVLSPLQP